MHFRSVLGVMVAAVVFFASSAEAQHRHRPTPTPTPATASAPTTPPDATPPTTPPQANSRDQEARMLFEAARVAYAAGRFEDSLGYFQRAYEMSNRPVLLYNIGSAADKLRRDAVALDAFRRYLEAMPTAENREEVTSRIQVLEQVVSAEQAHAVPTVTAPPVSDTGTAANTTTTAAGTTDETAHEGDVAASLHLGGTGDDTQRDSGGGAGLFGQWWFWTIVGVVVVGATVGIIAAASSGGGLLPFQSGTDGHVYMTLGAL